MSKRAERRRQEKAKTKTATYNMTVDSLAQSLEEAARRERERVIKKAVHEMSVATAFVAHDKLGFGSVRLQRFLVEIMRLWDALDKGLIIIADMEKALLDETGVEVK